MVQTERAALESRAVSPKKSRTPSCLRASNQRPTSVNVEGVASATPKLLGRSSRLHLATPAWSCVGNSLAVQHGWTAGVWRSQAVTVLGMRDNGRPHRLARPMRNCRTPAPDGDAESRSRAGLPRTWRDSSHSQHAGGGMGVDIGQLFSRPSRQMASRTSLVMPYFCISRALQSASYVST